MRWALRWARMKVHLSGAALREATRVALAEVAGVLKAAGAGERRQQLRFGERTQQPQIAARRGRRCRACNRPMLRGGGIRELVAQSTAFAPNSAKLSAEQILEYIACHDVERWTIWPAYTRFRKP